MTESPWAASYMYIHTACGIETPTGIFFQRLAPTYMYIHTACGIETPFLCPTACGLPPYMYIHTACGIETAEYAILEVERGSLHVHPYRLRY